MCKELVKSRSKWVCGGGGLMLPISTNVFSVKLSVLFGKASDLRKDPCTDVPKIKLATSSTPSHHHQS